MKSKNDQSSDAALEPTNGTTKKKAKSKAAPKEAGTKSRSKKAKVNVNLEPPIVVETKAPEAVLTYRDETPSQARANVPASLAEDSKPSMFSHLGVRKNGNMKAADLPPPPLLANGENISLQSANELFDALIEKSPRPYKVPPQEVSPFVALPEVLGANCSGTGTYTTPFQVKIANIEAAFITDVGQVRSNNQDNATAFAGMSLPTEGTPEMLFGYFAVADGMGGHDKGEVASKIAIQTSVQGILRDFYDTIAKGQPPGDGETSPNELIVNIIEEANVAILKEAERENLSMGTTLSSFVVVGGLAYIGHIGDSRLYAIERDSGRLVQLTEDHSVVARLVATGLMTREEALDSPQRSMLYRSLGQRPKNHADSDFVYLSDYSRFLICSDGLWDMVTDNAIEYFLKQERDPVQICRNLVDAANSAGGDDNVTVVVVKL